LRRSTFAGGPGTPGENKMGTPGPETTKAVWMNLGTVDVDTARKGTLMATIDVDKGDLDEHALVIHKKSDDAKVKASVKDIIACGIVKEASKKGNAG
jgi:hypothetical protein